jgi:hypothetical protein
MPAIMEFGGGDPIGDTRQMYDALARQLDAESRRMFGEVWPEDRKVVPLEEAAALMGRAVDEIRRLAELRLLYARREDGVLKVEPAIL